MKVIRQICYEGTEEQLREALARSMPEGRHDRNPGAIPSMEIRTVYSELPELEPFIPVDPMKELESDVEKLEMERDRYRGALEDILTADETSTMAGLLAVARHGLETS